MSLPDQITKMLVDISLSTNLTSESSIVEIGDDELDQIQTPTDQPTNTDQNQPTNTQLQDNIVIDKVDYESHIQELQILAEQFDNEEENGEMKEGEEEEIDDFVELADSVSRLNNTVKGMEKKIGGIGSGISEITSMMSNVEVIHSQNSAEINRLNTKILNFQSQMNDKLSALNTKVELCNSLIYVIAMALKNNTPTTLPTPEQVIRDNIDLESLMKENDGGKK